MLPAARRPKSAKTKSRRYVDAGGLMSYSTSIYDVWRRAGSVVKSGTAERFPVLLLACGVHPEFGYLGCPLLCRKLGLVLAFIVFGLVAGARSVAVFMADPDPDPMHAMALAPAEALDSATSSLPTTTVETKAVQATLAQKTTKAGGFKSSC